MEKKIIKKISFGNLCWNVENAKHVVKNKVSKTKFCASCILFIRVMLSDLTFAQAISKVGL